MKVGGSPDIAHVQKSFIQSLGQGCMFPHGNALSARPWAYYSYHFGYRIRMAFRRSLVITGPCNDTRVRNPLSDI